MMPIRFNWSWLAYVGLLVSISLCSCSYQVETSEETNLVLNDDDLLAVVGYSGVPEDLLECVRLRVQRDLPVMPDHEFRDALFPWFERSTTPITQTELEELLEREQVATELESLKVRYIVAIGGGTIIEGGGGCLRGPIGGVCGGSWDHSTHLAATVLDPKEKSVIEAVDANVEGTSWYLLLAIIPLGAPALTQTAACDEVVQRLTETFSPQRPNH